MGTIPLNQSAAQSALFFKIVVVLMSIYLIATVISTSTGINQTTRLKIVRTWSPALDDKLPLCSGNLLDQQQFHYCGSCQLLDYTTERMVSCLDSLRDRQPHKTKLHFLFMGDSRTRQQFLNFVRLVPDYDKTFEPIHAPLQFQGNMEMISEILGLRLTFKWQPFINDDLKNLIAELTNSKATGRLSFILLSMALWHMFHIEHSDHLRYQKKLTEVAPVLAQLSNVTRVIWLNQYPTLEFYGDNLSTNTQIHSEKINKYNKIVRRILIENHNGTKVQIWDSGNPLVEEYVRSCDTFRRYEIRKSGSALLTLNFYSSPYRNCVDFTHTGYSALSQITQLLLNDICSSSKIV